MSLNTTALQWLNATDLSSYAKNALIVASDKSTYLKGLMEASASRGDILTTAEVGTGGGTTWDSAANQAVIKLEAGWMIKGAGGLTDSEFASIVGHELGHALLAGGIAPAKFLEYSPDFAVDQSTLGEGVALTAEWIIGRQLGINYAGSKSFLQSQAVFMNKLDGRANELTTLPVSQWVYSKDSNNVSTKFTSIGSPSVTEAAKFNHDQVPSMYQTNKLTYAQDDELHSVIDRMARPGYYDKAG